MDGKWENLHRSKQKLKKQLISLLLLLGIGIAFPVVASAQTEVVVTKQRVTGCTIIEIYEDGKVVSVYYRYDNLE